jgi:hypothetical protein|tara:strand:- start:567 stop:845 length:279 start_codon:yes stop_codon:yes gene_type:complete
MNTITTEQAKQIIYDNNCKIFNVEFIKKDGTHRLMTARLQVQKGVKGVGLKFDPFEHNLITAFDMRKGAFRMINCNNLISLSSNKKKYVISD